jgi:hypothetical protein
VVPIDSYSFKDIPLLFFLIVIHPPSVKKNKPLSVIYRDFLSSFGRLEALGKIFGTSI